MEDIFKKYQEGVDKDLLDFVFNDDSDATAAWLAYSSYAWNRHINPDVEAGRWGYIFPGWVEFEKIYQEEIKKQKETNDG